MCVSVRTHALEYMECDVRVEVNKPVCLLETVATLGSLSLKLTVSVCLSLCTWQTVCLPQVLFLNACGVVV